jgi:hypothetical protein
MVGHASSAATVGKDTIVIFDSESGRTHRLPKEPEALAAFAATLTCSVRQSAKGRAATKPLLSTRSWARDARSPRRCAQGQGLHPLTTRRDLIKQRVACANRLGAPGARPIVAGLQHLLDGLDAEINGLEAIWPL